VIRRRCSGLVVVVVVVVMVVVATKDFGTIRLIEVFGEIEILGLLLAGKFAVE
jgi:hypothetical protein